MDSDARSGGRAAGEGQVLILFALFAFVLVGVLALAVDVGYLLTERREVQSAADAAALAGASALLGGSDSAQVTLVSQDYADANGVDLASGTINVDVDGDRHFGQVTVDVEVPVQRFFLGAIYTGPWEVGAHAVAEVINVPDANYALVALDPPGIYVNGSMQLTVVNGGMISNDDIEASGGANVITSHGFIDAVGTINDNDQWSADDGIREFRSPIADPFDSVTPPDPPGGTPFTEDINCPPTCTMDPGYYQDVKISVSGEMTLNSGLYYFEDTSIELGNTTSQITGAGVTLFFDGLPSKAYFNPKNGNVNLTAPNHPTPGGDYGDMAIWIDNCALFPGQGNGDFYVGGVIYAPCSEVYLHGNPGGETVSGMVVSSYLDIRGDSNFTISYIPYAPTESYEVYLSE